MYFFILFLAASWYVFFLPGFPAGKNKTSCLSTFDIIRVIRCRGYSIYCLHPLNSVGLKGKGIFREKGGVFGGWGLFSVKDGGRFLFLPPSMLKGMTSFC